ncbi:aspartate/glutamate racemase family protein [Streptococcus hyointestinalis]|uniref:Amino acid recemase n=1 Tax=Streptococcus hyointestinalis TaxID=1337 RepID=A0A380KAB9_9STRE|nr:aspartate/glutamate racemase family protein [Streptococcus hyointestinalis]SUN61247.1 amino acid recemase [Streptococcus hyointestinalis]
MKQTKVIGLIGGMTWESTITYYQVINETVKEALGGLHSAKILLYSVDFAEIEACQSSGDWEKSAAILTKAAKNLEQSGADVIVICTNTMHKIVPQMEKELTIPILHIAEATADSLLRQGIQKVALLGTKYTMTQDFYKDVLTQKGLETLVPNAADIELVNDVIYQELCLGLVLEESRTQYQRIIQELKDRGAEADILGCTEIGLLIKPEDSSLPVFDTTLIHAEKAAQWSVT